MEEANELLDRLCTRSHGVRKPTLLVVAAHPDDDVIGAGGHLPLFGARAHVAYISDGAPRNPRFCREAGFSQRSLYAAARRAEASRALALAGINEQHTHELGAIDQEVALELDALVKQLAELVHRLAPEALLSHAYEGGHPDHDATALLVHAACELLRRAGRRPPLLLEFASYHERGGELEFGVFLPEAEHPATSVELAAQELDQKLTMLACHATQQSFWRLFPLSVECFRIAPRYDFARPPAAPFFYDRVDFGLAGEDFLTLARAELAALGIEGPC